MNKYFALLVILSLPMSAADSVFTGALERVTHASVSIRMADGLAVDAVLPPGIPVPYEAADQVEIVCKPVKTAYDSESGLHYHLQLVSLRLVRSASAQEREDVFALLSWQRGANLLPLPDVGAPAESQFSLERVRQVNLEYVSRIPNFVADEVARRYFSDGPGKPWRLDDTIEDEITLKDDHLTRQQIHRNGKPWNKPFNQLPGVRWVGFGLQLKQLFDPACPTKIDFAGTVETGGKQRLVYVFSSPPDACFATHYFGGHFWSGQAEGYNPRRTGRILVDSTSGNVIWYAEQADGYPEKFALDRHTLVDSWDYVTIGKSTHLVPVSAEFVAREPDGRGSKVEVQYKNHGHFEAATSVTFDKEQ